eukprot:COSAG01_NODE_1134_length_11558_cov_8.381360_12_plen_137_part_00
MLCVALSVLAHAPASACGTPPAPRQFTLSQPRALIESACRGKCMHSDSIPPAEILSAGSVIRVPVERMGSQESRIVGESQSVLVVISPMISPRTRINRATPAGGGGESVHDVALVHGDALPQALHLPEFHHDTHGD